MTYQFYACLICKILFIKNMKTKRSKSKKEKTVVLSAAELTKFGMGVLTKADNVVN